MKPTTHHLALWNRLHAPAWVSKIESRKRFLPVIVEHNEIHYIINSRVEPIKKDWHKIDNSINLYQLARRNALRGKSQFSLEEYAKEIFGGGSQEHLKNFNRWIRKINKAKNRA
jgi:hypothetical protein